MTPSDGQQELLNGGLTMLQTNLVGNQFQFSVFNPSNSTNSSRFDDRSQSGLYDSNVEPEEPAVAPCPLTERLIVLFEEITGWQSEFVETKASLARRRQSTSKSETAQGAFSIVDMSESWPALKPTGHRGKCDQFVALFNELIGKLHRAQCELKKTQSALVALDTTAEMDEEFLVDSFVPKFGLDDSETPTPETGSIATDRNGDFDEDFEVQQSVSDTSSELVCPPFEGWSLGGSTGIVDDRFLDWMVDGDEHITIMAGEIDRVDDDDRVSKILVDPLTHEYHVSPIEKESTPNCQAFYLWDSRFHSLSKIDSDGGWHRLKSHQAIVATPRSINVEQIASCQEAIEAFFRCENESDSSTDSIRPDLNGYSSLKPNHSALDCQRVPTGQLAEMLVQLLESPSPLLVLQRD